jgi:hypothetical protein
MRLLEEKFNAAMTQEERLAQRKEELRSALRAYRLDQSDKDDPPPDMDFLKINEQGKTPAKDALDVAVDKGVLRKGVRAALDKAKVTYADVLSEEHASPVDVALETGLLSSKAVEALTVLGYAQQIFQQSVLAENIFDIHIKAHRSFTLDKMVPVALEEHALKYARLTYDEVVPWNGSPLMQKTLGALMATQMVLDKEVEAINFDIKEENYSPFTHMDRPQDKLPIGTDGARALGNIAAELYMAASEMLAEEGLQKSSVLVQRLGQAIAPETAKRKPEDVLNIILLRATNTRWEQSFEETGDVDINSTPYENTLSKLMELMAKPEPEPVRPEAVPQKAFVQICDRGKA